MTSPALRSLSNASVPPAAWEREWLYPAADGLDSDRIDFDAWLLAPVAPDGQERLVRRLSQAAGPVALLLAAVAGLAAAF